MRELKRLLIMVTLLSISMAMLESAVVIYLRELYYASGFDVAFRNIPSRIIIVELTRELATLIMLFSIGFIVGKNARTRFAWFLYSFAIWDIFYYVFLKVFINWPLNIFDWDILFLIPITWLAPVFAPVICSFTMILLSLIILFLNEKRPLFKLKKSLISILIAGSFLIYISFSLDYSLIVLKNDFYKDFTHLLQNQEFLKICSTYIPQSFNWWIFGMGELIIMYGIYKISRSGIVS